MLEVLLALLALFLLFRVLLALLCLTGKNIFFEAVVLFLGVFSGNIEKDLATFTLGKNKN